MINLNGLIFTDINDLETYMTTQSFSDLVKQNLRNEFNNVSNYVAPTQAEIDALKYSKRAEARNKIIVEMATENMERIRAGTWTVPQLIELTQDVQLKEILLDLNSLSFEIAYGKIDSISNPLITSDIKTNWKNKLAQHFYNS